MATCKYCGKWSGLFDNEHFDCAQAAAQGKTLENFTTAPRQGSLTAEGVFWGVFFALWAFSISAGIVVYVLRELLK
jgi:hypothetical protein